MLNFPERRTTAATESDNPSKRGSWLSRNGSLVVSCMSLLVAASSVCVAVMSLWYTIDAQRSDQYYREISIQPSLGFHFSTGTYSISLDNKGLGPAKIARIITNFGECLDSKVVSAAEWDNSRIRVALALHQDLTDKVLTEAVWRINRARAPDLQVTIPVEEQMIIPGQKLDLIAMMPEQIAPFNEEISRSDPQLKAKMTFIFADWARSVPIAVRSCSASGKFCRMVHPPFAELKGCPPSW